MWPFKKREKTPYELFVEHVEFCRRHATSLSSGYHHESKRELAELNKIITEGGKLALNKDLEKRLKSIEDAISDLYLVGKSNND